MYVHSRACQYAVLESQRVQAVGGRLLRAGERNTTIDIYVQTTRTPSTMVLHTGHIRTFNWCCCVTSEDDIIIGNTRCMRLERQARANNLLSPPPTAIPAGKLQ